MFSRSRLLSVLPHSDKNRHSSFLAARLEFRLGAGFDEFLAVVAPGIPVVAFVFHPPR